MSSLLRESIVGHQRAVASVRTLVSKLITEYVGGIALNEETPTVSSPPVFLRPDHWHQIQILKEITRHFIINRSDVAIFQHGQKKTLRELMELLRLWCKEYGEAWIRERPRLRPKTVALYEGLWRLHITPSLGKLTLTAIRTPRLRKWRRELLDSGVGPVTVAKAYRLLRSVLNTAVADRLIGKNPCEIPGAGQEKSPERPTATVEQVS